MSEAKSLEVLQAAGDIVLGAAGSAIPPSVKLDHLVRYLGTWSGSDKLMMLVQYTAKLSALPMTRYAEAEHRLGRRLAPASPTAEGLFKFAGQLSLSRRVSGLWGLLAILKGISALERNPATSSLQLTLQRLQGLSMLIYYPLEYLAFFSSPFAPVIPPRIISPSQSTKIQMWSIRAWGVYVLLQVWICANELGELSWKEDAFRKALEEKLEELEKVEGEKGKVKSDLEKVLKRKKQVRYQLIANASRLPVILHWSLVKGFYKNEFWTNFYSFISAVAAFRGGWEGSRLPSPMH
ncbi:uncharacterized protein EI90DRAFT_3068567 [Cantharellus anzutake]|uniref:uncharacterized protein n=1 Tax=Cantharellus anzutake TaxID=1750568 RepID=UPI001903107F|nr:uncharacterized protein EI90DRAFT_3068567 [Cantharellus anzutake]KAF8327284.1 hypothetical protein EI90DRAFT_3068567 [Cantharellus anzutake]